MEEKKETKFNEWELAFLEKLEEYIKQFPTILDAAKSLDTNLSTLNSFRKKRRHPKITTVQAFLSKMGVSLPNQDISGIIKRIGENAPIESVPLGDGISVPIVAQAGAGAPIDFWNSGKIGEIKIMPRYWRENARIIEVTGDSMEPLLKKGSYAAVVPFDGIFSEGGIYLINLPYFGLVIKRIKADSDGSIILVSDNPAYKPQKIEYEGHDDLIIGKVIWYIQEA